MTRDQIRAIFMANGFTIKEGQTDLKPYVYEAAEALLSASIADTAGAKDAEASFNDFADRYDHESNEWLDMDVQTFYIEGYKAALAAPPAPSVADAAGASEDARDAARYRAKRAFAVSMGVTENNYAYDKDSDSMVAAIAAIAKGVR